MKFFNHLRNLSTHHRVLRNRFHPLFNNTNFFSDASSLQQSTTPHVQQPSPPSFLNRTPHVKQPSPPSSLNRDELAKFTAIAESRYCRWNSEGPFKPLHVMNPTRLAFIRPALCQHFSKDPYSGKPLEGLKTADEGCGGGIISKPSAQMGATVAGIDAAEKNINDAQLDAESDSATSTVELCSPASEKLLEVEEGETLDKVKALKVGTMTFVCLKNPFFLAATFLSLPFLSMILVPAGGFLIGVLLPMTLVTAGVFSAFLTVCATVIYIGALSIAIFMICASTICTAMAFLITPALIIFYPVLLIVWLIARKSSGYAKPSLMYKCLIARKSFGYTKPSLMYKCLIAFACLNIIQACLD